MPYLDQPGVQNMTSDIRTLADQTYAGINHTHNYVSGADIHDADAVHAIAAQSVATATDTYFDNAFVAPSKGTFIGLLRFQFAAGSSGRRMVRVMRNNTDNTRTQTNSVIVAAPSNAQPTQYTLPVVMALGAGQGIGCMCYHNQGSALSCSGTLSGTFIPV